MTTNKEEKKCSKHEVQKLITKKLFSGFYKIASSSYLNSIPCGSIYSKNLTFKVNLISKCYSNPYVCLDKPLTWLYTHMFI